ncbi:high-affinity branched-chain amino acid ABC transporter permease LivM [uncultured Cohaesibacter sp.]|uniref:high-affinity branched-chain amino acid ABC transporter permease LivM n=1 Tax=uncultured Cohaesibacter sp. TaxID=1002546 RepID=UPI002AABE1BA|nr:high-affinity branched-chain amino acid ABC transporter permease LivM [uncultured Cohaesibacter sp.]
MSDFFQTRVGAALKDAALAAVITLLLASIMVGLRTKTEQGGLVIVGQWGLVAWMVGIVFVGRLAMSLLIWRGNNPVANAMNAMLPKQDTVSKIGKLVGPLLLLFAVTLPFYGNRYVIDMGILVLTYIMLGWGLNIVVGLAGLLDLGYVAFYAVGAYSYALFAQYFDLSFWVCLPLAGILAAFWGMILGFPVLRLRGDYLAIVTLAFGEIIRVVLLNWYEFTGGPDGISRIPRPSFFGLEFTRKNGFADFFGLDYSSMHRIIFLFYLILILALITNFVTMRLRKLPIGRAWEALREDEIACRSLGINTTNTKLTAFALGAMFGGFAGAFFATRQGFISPESFTFMESAIILAIVVLGGLGSQLGVVIASLVMIGGFEVFRDLEDLRMLVFGLLMVGIMIWKPRGIVSSRAPSVFLKEKKSVSGDLVAEGEG